MNFLDVRLPDRFWKKCTPEPNSGCWIWLATTSPFGYGYVKWNNRNQAAHRVTYQVFVGDLIPGFEIDHLCRNTSCVNPLHLEQVTHVENVRRGARTGPRPNPETACRAGHLYIPGSYLVSIAPKGYECRKCKQCAADRYRARDSAKREQYRAARIKRYREIVAAGLCAANENHGPATKGIRCEECARKHHEGNLRRRKPA